MDNKPFSKITSFSIDDTEEFSFDKKKSSEV